MEQSESAVMWNSFRVHWTLWYPPGLFFRLPMIQLNYQCGHITANKLFSCTYQAVQLCIAVV